MKQIGELPQLLIEKPWIFRIELMDRFMQILEHKELVFVRPTCWSDPLENIIFNAKLIKDGQPFAHPAKQHIYGQCWSYDGDSYALWQIYTTKTNNKGKMGRHIGVRITTHIDRLKQLSERNAGDFYYGLVEYKWKKELDKLPKDAGFIKGLKVMDLDIHHLKTLLVKRRSYAYENEFRLLAVPHRNLVDTKQDFLCRLKIEPTEFISSILVDPAMDHDDFKKFKEKLVTKYGFEPHKIKHSTLAAANRFVFNLDK